jgi:hypothetical protein
MNPSGDYVEKQNIFQLFLFILDVYIEIRVSLALGCYILNTPYVIFQFKDDEHVSVHRLGCRLDDQG